MQKENLYKEYPKMQKLIYKYNINFIGYEKYEYAFL